MPWDSNIPLLIWFLITALLTAWLFLIPPDKKLLAMIAWLDYTLIQLFFFWSINWALANYYLRFLAIILSLLTAWWSWRSLRRHDWLPGKSWHPATLLIMRWALQKWERVAWLNRYFAGTWPPRIEMDLLPGYFCGAHFLIVADKPLETVDDFIPGGRAMQRFWLTATSLALKFQPEMTPLIFARYRRQELTFSADAAAKNRADVVRYGLASLMGVPAPETCGVFMGRVGAGPTPTSRSLRKSLFRLGVR